MSDPRALLGMKIVGGGKKTRTKNNNRTMNSYMQRYMRRQHGGEWSCQSCTMTSDGGVGTTSGMPLIVQPYTGNGAVMTGMATNNGGLSVTTSGTGMAGTSGTTGMTSDTLTIGGARRNRRKSSNKALDAQYSQGGKKSKEEKKMRYKKRLQKYSETKLRALAKSYGVVIKKKRNGRTSFISNDRIIEKLCEKKHGK
jgi:hypothetical protein